MTTPNSTLRSIALEQPATIRVFERFHLDYCCGGNRPLEDACREKGLEVETVLNSLAAATGEQGASRDFSTMTATALMRHIVATHHVYVREELPRLLPLAEKAAAKHGPKHPELQQVYGQLQELGADLLMHLRKEEQILFPYIEALEESQSRGGDAPHACFASVASPIGAMLNEHEVAGALLEQMRKGTGGFTAPKDSCPTLVGLMHGLDAFERDLHQHIHLENNLLFPMAIEMEKAAQPA